MNLPDFKARSFVDPDTGCWHWLGSMIRGTPLIQIDGKRYRVARLSKLIKPGRYPYMKCGHKDCVNPAHIQTRSRSEYVKEAAKTRRIVTSVQRRRHKEASAKLNLEVAKEIRNIHAEGLSLRKIGQRYGVNYETVRNVVTHRTWREASPWNV